MGLMRDKKPHLLTWYGGENEKIISQFSLTMRKARTKEMLQLQHSDNPSARLGMLPDPDRVKTNISALELCCPAFQKSRGRIFCYWMDAYDVD